MVLNFQNVDTFCAAIDLTSDNPAIDLSTLTFIEPFALIYLGQFIRHHNREGKYFRVVMPAEGSRVRRYLARIRFWERFNFDADTVSQEGLLRFTSNTSANDIVELIPDKYVGDDAALLVEGILRRARVNVDASAVLEAVAELADNFVQHAQAELATLAVQYYPNRHQFAVAIGDCGLGIRQSLGENPVFAYVSDLPHWEAIAVAFEPMASRRQQAGMGLTNVRDRVIELNGNLMVTSHDGWLYISSGETPVMGMQKYKLPGVQIEVRFPER